MILRVTDCIHGFSTGECGDCDATVRRTRGATSGTATGKRFALVYAPTLDADSFIHLNEEGDHWKLRSYPSAHEPALVLAGSAVPSTSLSPDLDGIERIREIAYPHSTSGGVTVEDSRYWHDAIAAANAQHADLLGATRLHARAGSSGTRSSR